MYILYDIPFYPYIEYIIVDQRKSNPKYLN